jgi:signal transduction histidine kinase
MFSYRSLLFFFSVLLVGFGILSHQYFKTQFDEAQVVKKITANVGRQLQQADALAKFLLAQPAEKIDWTSAKGSFFLIDHDEIVAWSNNNFVPDVSYLRESFTTRYLKNQRGDFVLRKWNDSTRYLIAVIPLVEKFKVANKYLQPDWNRSIFPIKGIEILDVSSSFGIPIYDPIGAALFKVKIGESVKDYPLDKVSTALEFVGLLILCISGISQILKFHERDQKDIAFVFGVFFLFGVRFAMIQFGFPMQWGKWNLFDPQQFASSSFNVSLGDFLLNSFVILLACWYVFVFYSRFKVVKWILRNHFFARFIGSIVLLTFFIFSFLYPFLFFEIIFHNSSIPLDITQKMAFNDNRFWTFATIIFGTLSSFLMGHVLLRIVEKLVNKRRVFFLLSLAIAVMLFLLYCLMENHDYTITLAISACYILILHFLSLNRGFSKVEFSTFIYLLIAITAYGVQGAWSIGKFSREATVASQFRFGNNNLVNRDNLGEYLLSEATQRMSIDPFIQYHFTNPLLPKGIIRQRVAQVYLGSYFDRYAHHIYLFNSLGESVQNQSSEGIASSIRSIQTGLMKTDYPGVYRMESLRGDFARKYIGIVPIRKLNAIVGFVVLDLSLKHVLPQSVYPELLVDNRFSQFVSGKDFSYAFYSKAKLVSSFGDFNYQKEFNTHLLSQPSLYERGFQENDFIHVAVEGDAEEVAIVTSAAYPAFGVLANFSFLFVIGLMIILFWMLAYWVVSFWQGAQLNYSTRIQLYIYIAFALPLVVVSAVTISLISRSNETQLQHDWREQSGQLAQTIGALVEEPVDFLAAPNSLEKKLEELSKSSNADINVYFPNGHLMASSQPEIFNSQLTSDLMNRSALKRIVNDQESYIVNNENIGLLNFNSGYFAIKSSTSGELIAILNLPFFKSVDQVDRIQAIVFSNILVVFVGVFILFSCLSYYAVQWLTFPFQLITKTLKNTNLEKNQLLKWRSDDEIGLMVNEYNRMVQNLEVSRVQLARTQKESAWREMAQQVAHEIKNPLTPMKLTLQQMELAYRGELEKQSSIRSLLNQVEILNQIASSFSTFAKMPTPLLEKIEVMAVLKNTVDLYANYSSGLVELQTEVRPVFVLGDEQLMSRIFSNLILNGLQSGTDDQPMKVSVRLMLEGSTCVILIQDNGAGISSDMIDKMFLPFFSTKKSGSGLGLAIARQGIEQFGGTIAFTTLLGKGTEFRIELPIIE